MSRSQSNVLGTADVSAIEAPVSIRSYLICAFASFGGILFGYDSGYISGVLGMASQACLETGNKMLTSISGICKADHGSCCSYHQREPNWLHLDLLSEIPDCVYPFRWHLFRRAYWRSSSGMDRPSSHNHAVLLHLCYRSRHPSRSFHSEYSCWRSTGRRSGCRWSISCRHSLRL